MEQMNFHKQKLYSLIIAGVGLISLLLPWFTVKAAGFGAAYGASKNGFGSWGLVVLLGLLAVAVACFMGNKALPFDDTFKKVALAGFGAMAAGAVIYLIRILSYSGGGYVKTSPGFGLIIGLLAGLAGLGFLMGMIKIPENKKPPIS